MDHFIIGIFKNIVGWNNQENKFKTKKNRIKNLNTQKKSQKALFCGIKNTNAYNRVGVESDINHYTIVILKIKCVQIVFKLCLKCEKWK